MANKTLERISCICLDWRCIHFFKRTELLHRHYSSLSLNRSRRAAGLLSRGVYREDIALAVYRTIAAMDFLSPPKQIREGRINSIQSSSRLLFHAPRL